MRVRLVSSDDANFPVVVAPKWHEESLSDSGRACHASPSSQGLTMNGPGCTEATQLRSGALGVLKKDFMTSGPQGLTRKNEAWAAPFIRTTVELEMPLFLMSSPLRALVEGSNVPTMISVRMALVTGWRTAGGAPSGRATHRRRPGRTRIAGQSVRVNQETPGRAASTW